MQVSSVTNYCLHCGTLTSSEASFCCAGCESVYSLLTAKGLEHFYDLKKQSPTFRVAAPTKKATLLTRSLPMGPKAQFYLEGIHCLGCLWLLEKLPEIDPRIRSSSLDLTHQILEIQINSMGISWDEVITLIGRLGYRPHLIGEQEGAHAIKIDQRRQVTRIGVAAFCAGNIMLLAVSIYGGADSYWAARFSWISFFLAFPVLTYSAWPLYRGALLPLREKRISVDLAIVFALLAGTAVSLWSLLKGGKEIYFDSLSMLVFLLLSSRYLLSRIRESLAKEAPFLSYLSKEEYSRLNPEPDLVCAEDIVANDMFRLCSGQTVPVDSIVGSPAFFDLSLLTGESTPLEILPGNTIEAGAKLISADAYLSAIRPAKDSRLAKILSQVRTFQIKRSPSIDFADRMGKYFLAVVLSLAMLTCLLVPGFEGFRRALALVIVTCPCVLAFAVPLTLVRGMQNAARRGIFFRSPDKLEALSLANTIFLDKTGTLTTGEFEVLRYEQVQGSENETYQALVSLESLSPHPVAKAIVRRYANVPKYEVEQFKMQGRGVSGVIKQKKWLIQQSTDQTIAGENSLDVYCDGKIQSKIILGDNLREEALTVVNTLRELSLKPVLLSGDRQENVAPIAELLKIDTWEAGLSPEKKAARISSTKNSIMVGDGANDSVAFQAASVGIAMQGAVDLSLKNADVALSKPGLNSLLEAVSISKNTMSLMRNNFRTTLAYNLLAGILAVSGNISPLLAAILMPMSALSVFIFTQWKTREIE